MKRNSKSTTILLPAKKVLHARLMLERSSLNADIYRKHIVNSPSSLCGHLESVAHFLLHCPIFMNERQNFSTSNLRIFTAKDLLCRRQNTLDLENEQLSYKSKNLLLGQENLLTLSSPVYTYLQSSYDRSQSLLN